MIPLRNATQCNENGIGLSWIASHLIHFVHKYISCHMFMCNVHCAMCMCMYLRRFCTGIFNHNSSYSSSINNNSTISMKIHQPDCKRFASHDGNMHFIKKSHKYCINALLRLVSVFCTHEANYMIEYSSVFTKQKLYVYCSISRIRGGLAWLWEHVCKCAINVWMIFYDCISGGFIVILANE